MQLQQRILNATKKSQLPGLKHSALAVPSSQAEDFFASRLKKVFLRKGEPYNRHDSGSKDRGLIFRQGCFAVPQTINVQMMSVECKEESKGRGWWGKWRVFVFVFALSLSLSFLCFCLVYISLQRREQRKRLMGEVTRRLWSFQQHSQMFAAWESLLILKLTREEIICTLDSIAVSVFVNIGWVGQIQYHSKRSQ